MYVLAEHPVKHPNYPNGDHYAVLDTEDEVVEYLTIDEIKNYIKLGIVFIGNHFLATKDTQIYPIVKKNGKGVYREIESKWFGKITIVVYNATKKLNKDGTYMGLCAIEFERTGNLRLIRPTDINVKTKDLFGYSFSEHQVLRWTDDIFRHWSHILDRVGFTDTYINCSISDNFLNYHSFKNWFLSQPNLKDLKYIATQDKKASICIDKDILHKGNLTYSQDSCCLVPNSLNASIQSHKPSKKSNHYPSCIYLSSKDTSYITVNTVLGKEYIRENFLIRPNSSYDSSTLELITKFKNKDKIPKEHWGTVAEAFLFLQSKRKNYLKWLAEYWYNYEYEGKIYHCITKECYDALMSWEVDIND